MREHICIRRPEYVAGTVDKPEVGVFTQTHSTQKPAPWGRLSSGDFVWMKWTAGPVVARARIAGFRELPSCSAARLRDSVMGFALHDLDKYWSGLPQQFNALTIYLENEEWLEDPVEVSGRSYGSSWIVFSDSIERETWMRSAPMPVVERTEDPRGRRTAAGGRTHHPQGQWQTL